MKKATGQYKTMSQGKNLPKKKLKTVSKLNKQTDGDRATPKRPKIKGQD